MKKDKKTRIQKKSDMNNSGFIPWIVFLFTITIVLISSVPILFPAIVQSDLTAMNIPNAGPSQYELGVWSIPLIITNIIVFGLFVLYKKDKLPKSLESIFRKIFSFEVSKKTALITMILLLGIYVASSASDLGSEDRFEDYKGIKNRVYDQEWNISQTYNVSEPHVTYFFLKASVVLFGNIKVIPFLASIMLLITVYFFTKQITQKRFAGIVSVVIVMQSNLFLTYDTSATYTNFWIFFYLLSLYLVYRLWLLSPVSYLVSIPAKALTVVFLPMSIYFILRSSTSKKSKIIVASSTILIIVIASITAISVNSGEASQESFDAKDFWQGFTSYSYQLRSDGLVLLFMIPLITGLFIVSKRGIKHGESIMVLLSGMLLIAPILTGFTNQTNQPYRFIPLIVFFAVGIGALLSKIESKIQI